MNTKTVVLAVGAIALSLMAPDAFASGKGKKGSKGTKTYRVTITNISAGQPLTPPILRLGSFPCSRHAQYDLSTL